MGKEWSNIPMLARTHGQPATPSRIGKGNLIRTMFYCKIVSNHHYLIELLVFSERIQNQLKILKEAPMMAKFGGATGQLNAHKVSIQSKLVLFCLTFEIGCIS
jgi:adenylosuccinate lyase